MKTALAILAGLVSAFALIFLVELAAHQIWPVPAFDAKNPDAMRAAMEAMPPGALISVAAAWIVGTFGGGWLAARIARRIWPAYVIGGFVALASVANLLMLPHPLWFWPVALIVVPFTAHVAGALGNKRTPLTADRTTHARTV